MPSSWGMVVYKFFTSVVMRMASLGRDGNEQCNLMMSVSMRWEGISLSLRFRKKSSKVAGLAVGPELP